MTARDREPRRTLGDQERDLWWGAFAARSMLPSFLLCILLSAIVLSWYFTKGFERDGESVRHIVYTLNGSIWIVQGWRVGSRVFSQTYRLTTRRLFCARGFFFPPTEAVTLTDIERVEVEQSFWEREVGVGRLRLTIVGRSRPEIMTGVRQPHDVAERILDAVHHARLAASVSSA